jgi:ATP-dependent protease Clp ATPase subunit
MRMAQKAYEEQTGARGLVTVCERTLREYKYELPATGIKKFVVTKELVDDPEGELNKIISDPNYNERIVMRELLRQYTLKFFNEHGVKIEFDPEAEDLICQWSSQRAQAPDEVCKEVLKDYGYGLNLIKKNTGKSEFKLGMKVLKSPEVTLERWIKESYSEEKS